MFNRTFPIRFRFCAIFSLLSFFLQSASAQVTYLNTFSTGPGTAGGNLQYPILVTTGLGGQVLLTDPLNSQNKIYAPGGSFELTLVPNAATSFNPNHTTYAAIAPDGRFYLSSQTNSALYVFDTSGAGTAQIALADDQQRAGYAISPNGTIFIATSTAATQTAPAAAQISAYSAAGALLARFGDDRFDRASERGLALNADGSRIYAIDLNAIQQYTSSGTYVNTIGSASGPGQLSSPTSVAVSQTGFVYATDANAGIKVYSAVGVYLRTIVDTLNGSAFTPTSVAVGPTGYLYATSFITGSPSAMAARFFDPSAWAYGVNSFTNSNTGPTSVGVGAGALLGQSLTLRALPGNPAMGLNVGDTLTVSNGNLTIAGGSVTAGTLAIDGAAGPSNFTFTAGTLNAANIVVANGGIASISQPVAVAASSLRVSDAASRLSVDQNAALTVETLYNKGQIYLGSGASLIAYAAAAGDDGNGVFNLNGGTLDLRFAATLATTGIVQGSGTLATTGGFTSGGSVKLSGPSAVRGTFTNQPGGQVEISGVQPTIFFDPVINSGTFTIKTGAAAVFESSFTGNAATSAALNVAGAARFDAGGAIAALSVAGTSTAPTGTIDVGQNGLVISASVNGSSTSATALVNIRNLIIAGYHNGQFNGTGVISSAAQNDSRLAIGYARAADLFNGQGGTFGDKSVNANDVLIRATLAGDANLNGSVGFEDLVTVAQNYNTTVSNKTDGWWSNGDFNYDGVVDFGDLVKLAQNYGAALPGSAIPGASAAFEADLSAAFAAVPEPGAIGLLAITACGLLFRRR